MIKASYKYTKDKNMVEMVLHREVERQKGGDLTQSYDKSPYTNRNVKGAK